MLKGLNSDIFKDGSTYHVQTEDWGEQSAYILSRVFKSGAVIKSIKRTYTEVGTDVRRGLQRQHQEILDQITSGQIK